MVIFIVILLLFISISIYVFEKRIKDYKIRMLMVKEFSNYMAILEYFMNKSYDLVFKDKILPYSIDGFKMNQEELDNVLKEYVTLVMKLIGPNLQTELENLFGDRISLLRNITEYFHNRLENDQIRKTVLSNMGLGDMLGE